MNILKSVQASLFELVALLRGSDISPVIDVISSAETYASGPNANSELLSWGCVFPSSVNTVLRFLSTME
jgi:hypothetical protein